MKKLKKNQYIYLITGVLAFFASIFLYFVQPDFLNDALTNVSLNAFLTGGFLTVTLLSVLVYFMEKPHSLIVALIIPAFFIPAIYGVRIISASSDSMKSMTHRFIVSEEMNRIHQLFLNINDDYLMKYPPRIETAKGRFFDGDMKPSEGLVNKSDSGFQVVFDGLNKMWCIDLARFSSNHPMIKDASVNDIDIKNLSLAELGEVVSDACVSDSNIFTAFRPYPYEEVTELSSLAQY